MPELAYGQFPFYLLSEDGGIEPDSIDDFQKSTEQIGFNLVWCDGHPCVLVFSSPENASRYLKATKQPSKLVVPVENEYDFVARFGELLKAGISHAVLDCKDHGPAIYVSTEPLLGEMRARIGGGIRNQEPGGPDLPYGRKPR
jgi:hypothetical protein